MRHHYGWSVPAVIALALALALGGCGRSPVGNSASDAAAPTADAVGPTPDVVAPPIRDLRGPDVYGGDLGPCSSDCTRRCKLVTACGLYPQGPAQCLKDCPGWKPATSICLDGLVCLPGDNCDAAKACILSPPKLPDLVIKNVVTKVNGATVDYSFSACNVGDAPAPAGFEVSLFYDDPAPGQAADVSLKVLPNLAAQGCAPLWAQRTKTPDGAHASWLHIDPKESVLESNEGNNVKGPIAVEINLPKLPDLVVKTFDAKLSGSDIVYTIELCNQGNANAWIFRLDLFYSSVIAPIGVLGDQSVNFFLGLAAGKCQTITRSYKNVPVGIYNSWVKVDALGAVAESNEGNNVAGPKLITVNADAGCLAFCGFAISCGEFGVTAIGQCLTWCSAMDKTQRACAEAARQKAACGQLKKCSLPAKPPPPVPPWACIGICNYLVNDCKLIPADQNLTCIGGCLTLPATKRQCAQDAQKKNQCAPMLLCLL